MIKYTIIVILISFSFSQEIPGEPIISWMPTEYDLTDEGIAFILSWNMWWGENGDHWRLYENSNNIYEDSLISDSPNSQNDEISITLFSTGDYQYIVQLCNGIGESEICNESDPVIITINNNGDSNDEDQDDVEDGRDRPIGHFSQPAGLIEKLLLAFHLFVIFFFVIIIITITIGFFFRNVIIIIFQIIIIHNKPIFF